MAKGLDLGEGPLTYEDKYGDAILNPFDPANRTQLDKTLA